MYCKLFASLYQGTLRGRSNEILVFTNLLAHAGKDGTVDKHFRAISEETGLSVDEVKESLLVLESADPESRSPDENGARIVRMDEHRVWGWRIVNYGKYRAIRNEEDRAEQNRLAQERWREKNKPKVSKVSRSKPDSATDKQDKPKEREEAEGKGEEPKQSPPSPETGTSEKALRFADWFRKLLPATVNPAAKWRERWAECYDAMVKLDKRTAEEISMVCRWARADDFWAANFQSPMKLRERKDGVQYFDIFAAKVKSETPKPTPQVNGQTSLVYTAPSSI